MNIQTTPGRLLPSAYAPFGRPAPLIRMYSPPPPTYISPPAYTSPPPDYPESVSDQESPLIFLSPAPRILFLRSAAPSPTPLDLGYPGIRLDELFPEDLSPMTSPNSTTSHAGSAQTLDTAFEYDTASTYSGESQTESVVYEGSEVERSEEGGEEVREREEQVVMSVLGARLLHAMLDTAPHSSAATPPPAPVPADYTEYRTPVNYGPVSPNDLYRALSRVNILRAEGPQSINMAPAFPAIAHAVHNPANKSAGPRPRDNNTRGPALSIITDFSKPRVPRVRFQRQVEVVETKVPTPDIPAAPAKPPTPAPAAAPPTAPARPDLTRISEHFAGVTKTGNADLAVPDFSDEEVMAYFELEMKVEKAHRAEWATKFKWFKGWLAAQEEALEKEAQEEGAARVAN